MNGIFKFIHAMNHQNILYYCVFCLFEMGLYLSVKLYLCLKLVYDYFLDLTPHPHPYRPGAKLLVYTICIMYVRLSAGLFVRLNLMISVTP